MKATSSIVETTVQGASSDTTHKSFSQDGPSHSPEVEFLTPIAVEASLMGNLGNRS